jgi:hypothetical protein
MAPVLGCLPAGLAALRSILAAANTNAVNKLCVRCGAHLCMPLQGQGRGAQRVPGKLLGQV